MSTEELQKRTTVNIQEKANLIWAIADKLVGTYKPHEYGNVILPMCVIKRFSDTLAPTKQKVLDANAICEQRGLAVRKGFLTTASGYDFYNVSPFTFESRELETRHARETREQDWESYRHQMFMRQQRALMSDSLRYDILKRDGYRCRICGATQADGVKLHVDHIIPVSKGGRTEPSNLQTLCERCNLGKSNKL